MLAISDSDVAVEGLGLNIGVKGEGTTIGVYGNNVGVGPGVQGQTGTNGVGGVEGISNAPGGSGAGVLGWAMGTDVAGVRGASSSGPGVWGEGDTGVVAVGTTNGIHATGSTGVYADGTSYGVFADGSTRGVLALSDSGVAVEGLGLYIGVKGEGTTIGVYGNNVGVGPGVQGQTGTNGAGGVEGISNAPGGSGAGVLGWAMGTDVAGVRGASSSGPGVYGEGDTGVFADGAGVGAYGTASDADGVGLWGEGDGGVLGAGQEYGAFGAHGGTSGVGTIGTATGAGNAGVAGAANGPPGSYTWMTNSGVSGVNLADDGIGMIGANLATDGVGVAGRAGTDAGAGVAGSATLSFLSFVDDSGVSGVNDSETGYGVAGLNSATTGSAVGVLGQTSSDTGTGVLGAASSLTAFGVVGQNTGGAGSMGVFSNGDLGATGTKSFVQPHPTDASKEVRFVCLEGNESGTYFRGSARLEGGAVTIAVPEEFRMVTEAEGLTVQVTAMGPGALWVEEKSLETIVVRGEADVAFDYFVNGVRRGYADFEPIQPNVSYRPITAGVPYGAHHPEAIRDMLVANGTLNADLTPNAATAAAQGWTLQIVDEAGPRLESLDTAARTTSADATFARRDKMRALVEREHAEIEVPRPAEGADSPRPVDRAQLESVFEPRGGEELRSKLIDPARRELAEPSKR